MDEFKKLTCGVYPSLMTEKRDQNARWTEPTSIQGAELTPEEERAARRQYNALGDRTELVELGILPPDTGTPSEPAEE